MFKTCGPLRRHQLLSYDGHISVLDRDSNPPNMCKPTQIFPISLISTCLQKMKSIFVVNQSTVDILLYFG